jgi:hypothetical protein
VTGAGASQTVIDGNQIDRVLHIASGVAVEIRGMTIRNGHASQGGGIRSSGYQVSLTDSVVASNTSHFPFAHFRAARQKG